jgi:1,4-dihydroxy-2-naphthoate octaprenyltransferase
LRKEINANAFILITAIILDVIVLGAFLIVKAQSDMLVIYVALACMAIIFAGERLFLRHYSTENEGEAHGT